MRKELTDKQQLALDLASEHKSLIQIAEILVLPGRAAVSNLLTEAREIRAEQKAAEKAAREAAKAERKAAAKKIDQDWKRKLAEEDRENNRPKKVPSFTGPYNRNLDPRFPVFREVRSKLRAAGFTEDKIAELQKAGWDVIQTVLSEIVGKPKELGQPARSELSDSWQTENYNRGAKVPDPVPPQPDSPPQPETGLMLPLPVNYGRVISNHPSRPEDLRRVDTWRPPKPVHVKFLEIEMEAPIISELRRMTPAERALKMDDPDFVSRLKAHRDSLW